MIFGTLEFWLLFALAWLLMLCAATVYAFLLQKTDAGRWLAARRAWVTVVIGVGLVLGTALIVVPATYILVVLGLFIAGGIPMMVRSVRNEHIDEVKAVRTLYDESSKAS